MDIGERIRRDKIAREHSLEWSSVLKEHKEEGDYIQLRVLVALKKFYLAVTDPSFALDNAEGQAIIKKHAVDFGVEMAISHGIVMSLKEREK